MDRQRHVHITNSTWADFICRPCKNFDYYLCICVRGIFNCQKDSYLETNVTNKMCETRKVCSLHSLRRISRLCGSCHYSSHCFSSTDSFSETKCQHQIYNLQCTSFLLCVSVANDSADSVLCIYHGIIQSDYTSPPVVLSWHRSDVGVGCLWAPCRIYVLCKCTGLCPDTLEPTRSYGYESHHRIIWECFS